MIREVEIFLNGLIKNDGKDNTYNIYKKNLEMWFDFQEIKTLDDLLKITSFDIEEYNYFLVKKGLSVNTQFNYTMPIKQLYNYFYQRRLIDKSPYLLKYKIRNKKETKFLNTQDALKLIRGLKKPRDKALYSLILETGMRYGEVTNICIKDIQESEDGGFVRVVGKGNKERFLGFSKPTLNYIKDYIVNDRPQANNDILFITKHGNKIDKRNINNNFKSVLRKNGFEDYKDFHFHCLRHSFASIQIENGANVKELQEELGHSDISTTLNIYSHVTKNKMVNRMSANGLLNQL